MKIPLYGFCLLLFILLFSSCSITNRRYMPGYQVEWKGKSPVAYKNRVIKRGPENIQPKSFPLVNNNTVVVPVTKASIACNTRRRNKNVLTRLIPLIRNTISPKIITAPASIVNNTSVTLSPQEEVGNEFAVKLAHQSLFFGILAAVIALGFATVIVISIIHNAPMLILYIVCLGVVSITLALIAYFKGKRALPLLFGDDTAEKYYRMASLGRFLSYAIIIGLLLTLVLALAFFN